MARAPLQLDIRSNIDQVVRELQVRDPKLIRRATVSGLNAGMTAARKVTLKAIAGKVGVAQKYLRQRTKVYRASANILSAATQFVPRGLNPLKIGWNIAKANAYYRGPRAPGATAFVMRVQNGSEQAVVRLPKSVNPSPAKTADGARRKGRLPVQSIRVFIGRITIDEFSRNLAAFGVPKVDEQMRKFITDRRQTRPIMKKLN